MKTASEAIKVFKQISTEYQEKFGEPPSDGIKAIIKLAVGRVLNGETYSWTESGGHRNISFSHAY